jgi:hypothetical protein
MLSFSRQRQQPLVQVDAASLRKQHPLQLFHRQVPHRRQHPHQLPVSVRQSQPVSISFDLSRFSLSVSLSGLFPFLVQFHSFLLNQHSIQSLESLIHPLPQSSFLQIRHPAPPLCLIYSGRETTDHPSMGQLPADRCFAGASEISDVFRRRKGLLEMPPCRLRSIGERDRLRARRRFRLQTVPAMASATGVSGLDPGECGARISRHVGGDLRQKVEVTPPF